MTSSVSPPRDPIATRLTDEQEHPVRRRGEPLLLSAGAGSGKTSVLVERFVRAVREDELAPGKILAITFTDRAAGELRERVRARFLELGEREAARDTEAAFVGTFHGFCARVLRSHSLLAELDPDFAILEEGMAARLRERAFGMALRAFLERERPEQAVDLIAAYGVDRVRTMIASVHAQLRSCGERFPKLPAPQLQGGERQDLEAAAACRLLDELLAGFTHAYEQLKRDRAAVDFDDLELRARDLLHEHGSVRDSWSQRFELLMVDEFQDTNPRQLAILEALERENLFTVGDELQSIYGFRHADVELFRARRAELESRGRSLALTRNFRSRAGLIDVVNAVFQQRFAEFTPLHAGREARPVDGGEAQAGGAVGRDQPLTELLLSDRGGWEEDDESSLALAAGLPAAPRWRQAEARVLARRVSELVNTGEVKGGDVVVLLRALGDLDVYERALQQAGLRTLAAVGAFWEHQQVADLLAYLRTLANPLDELALYSTLASPLAGVSRDGLALLALAARQSGRPVWETAQAASAEPLQELAVGDRDVLIGFCERLREERAHCSRRTVSELIERAIEHSGYGAHALRLEWGERRLANVHKLLRLARRFEASEGRDLRAFLDHVDHLIGASTAGESDAPVDGVEPDAVRLMSIHGAKGLEFPVVCVADLGRAQNNRLPDLLVDGPRIGLQLVRLDGGKGTPTLDYGELAEARRRTEAEEEDRILYVAMTRARERLLLSASVDFQRWPEAKQGATAISWLGSALWPEMALLAQAAPTGDQELPVGHTATPVRVHFNTRGTIGLAMRRDVTSPSRRATDAGTELHGWHPKSEAVPAASPAPQRPPGKRIATLSYSSLSELERCGYRYYLERVLGLGEDRGAARSLGADRGLAARARGILVHRLLESLDFARPRPPTAEQVSRLAREQGMSLASGESAQIAGLLGAAASSTLAQRCAAAAEARREYPFAFSLGAGEPLVTGVIDVHAREHDGRVLVLDYKSDRVEPETDLQALVERHYGVQRLLYALAVLREGAPSVEVVHWFLERPEDWVTVSYEAAERAELEELLAQRLTVALQRGFAVSPQPHRGLCLTCPGRASLCSWGEETMREQPPDGETPSQGT